MNIYYYFSVSGKFFTEVTKYMLQTKGDITFSGLAHAKNDYFSNAVFKKISYLSDINLQKYKEVDYNYLVECEKKYQISISELIYTERHFYKLSKTEKLCFVESAIKIIEKDYEETPFDMVISGGLADLYSMFLFYFAKSKGIPFYYPITNRLGSSMYFSDRLDTGPVDMEIKFQKNIQTYQNKELLENTKIYIANYISKKTQPYYLNDKSMLFKILSINDIIINIMAIKKYIQKSNRFYADENPLLFPFMRLKRIWQKRNYDKLLKPVFLSLVSLEGKKFFIYPLHFHPEAATLIQGRWLHNQKVIIEMISRVLPIDTILIIKEHKVSIGRRPVEFYKAINKLFNVFFVSDKTEVYPLIEKSSGVITISSSMGLEAVMLNKPVICFGDIHYNILSQVIKARDISKMQEYINNALLFNGYDQNEYWAFLKTITDYTFEMPEYSPHHFSKNNVIAFCKYFEQIIDNQRCLE